MKASQRKRKKKRKIADARGRKIEKYWAHGPKGVTAGGTRLGWQISSASYHVESFVLGKFLSLLSSHVSRDRQGV